MDSYTTVEHYASYEYEDRKSVFIANVLPVSAESEAVDFIASVKKKYPDARHHVYAYALKDGSAMRFSDDGEPQGTAGMPVLDVIRKNKCTDIVIVVTRYFGGTLLGTGGLVRAYTSAAAGALKLANIIVYDIYSFFELTMSYSDYQKITSVLSSLNFKCEDVKYSDIVKISGKIKRDIEKDFIKAITEMTSGRTSINKHFEKFDY